MNEFLLDCSEDAQKQAVDSLFNEMCANGTVKNGGSSHRLFNLAEKYIFQRCVLSGATKEEYGKAILSYSKSVRGEGKDHLVEVVNQRALSFIDRRNVFADTNIICIMRDIRDLLRIMSDTLMNK